MEVDWTHEKDFMSNRRKKERPKKIAKIILFIFIVTLFGIAIFKYNPAQYVFQGMYSHISLEK